jgi:hypothetical protein
MAQNSPMIETLGLATVRSTFTFERIGLHLHERHEHVGALVERVVDDLLATPRGPRSVAPLHDS